MILLAVAAWLLPTDCAHHEPRDHRAADLARFGEVRSPMSA